MQTMLRLRRMDERAKGVTEGKRGQYLIRSPSKIVITMHFSYYSFVRQTCCLFSSWIKSGLKAMIRMSRTRETVSVGSTIYNKKCKETSVTSRGASW